MSALTVQTTAIAATLRRLLGNRMSGSWLAWLAYPLCFVICFVVFAYWTFPYDRLKSFAIQKIQARQPDLQVEIDTLRPWWLSGVRATGVRVTLPSKEPDERPTTLWLDDLRVRASLFSLLFSDPNVKLTAFIGDGSIRGNYQAGDETVSVRASFEDVDLRRLGLLELALGLPTRGRIDGVFELTLAEEAKDTEGRIDLTLSELVIGNGKRKLKLPGMGDGLTLEPLEAGDLVIRADIENGQANFEKVQGRGPDLELDVKGSVQLARELAKSRLNLTLTAKATDHYKNKSDRTQVLFELLEMNPAMKRARTPDGALSYRIVGMGTNVRGLPAGGPAKRR